MPFVGFVNFTIKGPIFLATSLIRVVQFILIDLYELIQTKLCKNYNLLSKFGRIFVINHAHH